MIEYANYIMMRAGSILRLICTPTNQSVEPATNRQSIHNRKKMNVRTFHCTISHPVAVNTPCLTHAIHSSVTVPQSHVQANLFGMYHNADLFYQPEEFLPERWLKSGQKMDPVVKSLSQLVWGHGARMCIGQYDYMNPPRETIEIVEK